ERRAGAAVRILLQGNADQGRRAARAESTPHRSADSHQHERPPLPLRNLSARDEGDQACGEQNGGSDAMNDTDTFCFSRRDLLKGGGALVIGFSIAGSPPPAAAAARGDVAGPPDPNAIDSWIAVHADNTATVYLGKGEFGQGNTTGLLQIAGEELDLDMSQLLWVQLDTNVTPNQGATTSSSSIHRGGPQVRAAAAEARHALLALASTRLGVQTGSLPVSKGVVSIDGHPTRWVTYGALLGDKPFNVKFTGTAPQKPINRYKLVGTSVPRVDIPDKASGTYVHMQHVRVPDMLPGRIVRPRGHRACGAGAKPLSIDASSIADIPGARVVRKGDFVGVVAEREWDAVKAARALKVTWQESPPLPENLFDSMRAAKTTDTVIADWGDAPNAFAQAAHVASSTYRCPYQSHAPFAANCALADVGPNGALVMSSTQDIYNSRGMLAQVLGLPVDKVRVQYHEHRRQRKARGLRVPRLAARLDGQRDHARARVADASQGAHHRRRLDPGQPHEHRLDVHGGEPARGEPRGADGRLPQGRAAALAARSVVCVRLGADDRRARVHGQDRSARVPPQQYRRRALARRAQRRRRGRRVEAQGRGVGVVGYRGRARPRDRARHASRVVWCCGRRCRGRPAHRQHRRHPRLRGAR